MFADWPGQVPWPTSSSIISAGSSYPRLGGWGGRAGQCQAALESWCLGLPLGPSGRVGAGWRVGW